MSPGNTTNQGQYGTARPGLTGGNPGYGGESPRWGGAAAPMSQYGTAQGPMGGQYVGQPAVHQVQGDQGWKDPNAPLANAVGTQEWEVRHELQTS